MHHPMLATSDTPFPRFPRFPPFGLPAGFRSLFSLHANESHIFSSIFLTVPPQSLIASPMSPAADLACHVQLYFTLSAAFSFSRSLSLSLCVPFSTGSCHLVNQLLCIKISMQTSFFRHRHKLPQTRFTSANSEPYG